MPMREECKFFESRTYRNGETVRKCDLDLAPEAPWRCPEGCKAYAPRLADVDWKYGTLVTPPTPAEPPSLGTDPSIAALLDEAEDIVNAAVPRIREEVDRERASSRGRGRGAGGAPGRPARGRKLLGRFFGRRKDR
jgi:hypothetical protein